MARPSFKKYKMLQNETDVKWAADRSHVKLYYKVMQGQGIWDFQKDKHNSL